MKLLRNALVALALAGLMGSLGCESAARNKEQQVRKYDRISDINRRLLMEDIDAILLLDEPSGLTDWYIPFE